MKRVVYYARVSTEEEQQASALQIQCAENEEFIRGRSNWQLVDKYIDEGKSGTTTAGRKEFLRMISDMKQDKFDIILIKQIDRGWRNLADWKTFERILLESGKMLFIRLRNEYYNVEDDGNYISTTMDSMFAEWYSRNLSRKMNNAHKTRMKKGTVVTNGKLWGYDQVNGDLVINVGEANVVRQVFNMYVNGKGFRTISLELETLGFKNQNGSTFSLTTLRRMIKNEKYKGVLICGKRHLNFFTKAYEDVPESEWIIHPNRVPQIVSEATWNEANRLLGEKRKELMIEEKSKIAGHFNGSFPLSGKILCGKCGAPYYHSIRLIGPKGLKQKVGVWQCSSYRRYGVNHEKGCNCSFVYEEDLHEAIREYVFKLWKNKNEVIGQVVDALGKAFDKNDFVSAKVDRFEEEIVRLNAKRDNLIDLYSDQLISKEDFTRKAGQIGKMVQELEGQAKNVTKLEHEIPDNIDRLESIKTFLELEFSDQSGIDGEIIKEVVEKVVVRPDKSLEIDYKWTTQSSCEHLRTG